MTLIGMDDEKGPLVYKCDPSGNFSSYRGIVSGHKAQEGMNYLEKKVKKIGKAAFSEQPLKVLLEMALNCLGDVVASQQHLKAEELEVGIVTKEDPNFRVLDNLEIDAILTEMEEKD